MPYTQRLLKPFQGSVPVIHFGTRTSPFLDSFAAAGGDVIGIDHHIGLAEAWSRIGPNKAIQGNMDPRFLLAGGPAMELEVRKILDEAGSRPGHIFNLGHGVPPEAPVENVKALVDRVHQYSARKEAVG